MVFHRRSSKGMVIDSTKHETRYSNLLEVGATVRFVDIAVAKNVQDISADNHVKTGSVIKAIMFENNWNVEGNITTTIDWELIKRKIGQDDVDFNPSTPNLPARSQTFLRGMEMPAGINNSASIKRIGTLLIPKGKQRMSEGDKWQLVYFVGASGSIADACGIFTYKEYR